ncbi:glycosyltransferase family 4 protein [Tenacibaculum sp. UWU-22]|uniref:glycosyltransferase family 4 protein n=1 Tax=Tenacibaculum sp. UWU-22 TaxID=3234187 RepID=UPI0034DB2346
MNKLDKKNIIVDIERMKYPNTGLYNYCKNLSDFLIKDTTFNYYFFAHKKINLPSSIKRINRKLIDKILLKTSSRFSLWHGTYQTTKFVPIRPIKFVFTIHDLNFLYEAKSENKKQKLLNKVQKRVDRADYITTISKFVLNDVQQHINLSGKKVKVIYNGVNLVRYPNFKSPSYKPKGKFLFTLGTVLPKKNVHVLLNLLSKESDCKLLIAGIQPDANYLEKIKKEAKKLDVEHNVVLLGGISEEEKYWYLNNCEAFLFPSIAEGFGIPVIEAMLLGKPVFLSTHTSLPEIGGEHAYYFQNFEPNSMKKVFVKGLKDYKENNKTNSIINWAEQFTWEKAAEAYINVYKEVLLLNNE